MGFRGLDHLEFHEDEIIGKAYDTTLMRRLVSYLRPHKYLVLIAFALLAINVVMPLVGPELEQRAIDDGILKGDYGKLNSLALIYIVVLATSLLFGFLQAYIMRLAGQRIMFDLRIAIFSHLQRLQMSYFDTNLIGRLMTRVTNDVEVLNQLFSSGLVQILADFCRLFVIFGFIWWLIGWDVALISLVTIPIIIIITIVFRKYIRVTYRTIRALIAKVNAYLQENITGIQIVKIFTREERNYNSFDEINKQHRDYQIRSIYLNAIYNPAIEIVSSLATAIIVWYVGGQIIRDVLSIGMLMQAIRYCQMLYMPIRQLSEQYNTLQQAMASSERIFSLLDTEVTIESPEDAKVSEDFRGEIEYNNVWFEYKPGEWVLKDVSFKVAPGDSVAIVGATGAGKTTITNLMTRFYDIQKGSILIDGIDVRQWDLFALRRHISVVLQDVFMFSGTIEENIRLGDELITREQVQQAAEYVNAHQFIGKLPNGYDTSVRERGATLSTGQKQLLSFARALVFNPDILILDEATSSVDTETELLIQDAVQKLMENRTSLIIAHRLSTIQHANHIVVLHKGEVKEVGTHQELLAHRGIYYKLYELQYIGQEILL